MASIDFDTLTFDNSDFTRFCGRMTYVPAGWSAVVLPVTKPISRKQNVEIGKLVIGRWGVFGYNPFYIVFEDECDATLFVLADHVDLFKSE